MRRRLSGFALLVAVAACGGGDDGGTNPPPSNATVVTVEVTPTSAALAVPETVQLTATPRDAGGNAVAGKTITWSTSAASVATVSSTGLVTSAAEGSATITATSDGKSGSAAITVTRVQGGPVVARAEIGPGGGTVGSTDIGVTIPAGAFTGTRTLMLIRDTVESHPFPDNAASLMYRIDGIPAGQTVQARVRIRRTTAVRNQAAIAMGSPVVPADSIDLLEMGYRLFAATDSSGWLVATVPIRGRPESWSPSSVGGPSLAAEVTPADFRAAAELSGLVDIRSMESASGHFKGWGFVRGTAVPATEVDRQLAKALPLMEQAYTKVSEMGFVYDHRTAWPIDVYVMPLRYYGAYWSVAPFPWDPNLGYFSLDTKWIDDPVEMPSTAIHEFFHFVQARTTIGWTRPQMRTLRWLSEATSTWIEEYHPALVGAYPSTVARDWKDTLYSGIDRDLNTEGGYGKAPMIKYLANRWGPARVNAMYGDIKAGVTPAAAFFMSFPEPAESWWPDLLKQHLTAGLYPWPPRFRIPDDPPAGNPAGAPQLSWGRVPRLGADEWQVTTAHALSTEFNFLQRNDAAELRTDWFGPDYRLPVYLKPASIGKAKLLAFRKAAGSAGYEFLGVGDTVHFPGALLASPDTALLLVTQTAHVAPYTGHSTIDYVVDLRLPNADWYFLAVSNVAEAMTYTCSSAGENDSLDIAENATSVFNFLARAGTWTWKPGANPQTWEWAVAPAMVDSLLKYRITATSALTLKGADSIVVTGRFTLDWLSSVTAGAPVPHLPVWVWLLVPVSALPFLVRRRLHRLAPWVAATTALAIGACEFGQIALAVDESFEFRFGKFRFTADSTRPLLVQMELRDGNGKTTVHRHQTEYWVYTYDDWGGIADSTKRTCTGTGTATYKLDGSAWHDGIRPPMELPPSLSALLGRPVAVPEALKSRVRP